LLLAIQTAGWVYFVFSFRKTLNTQMTIPATLSNFAISLIAQAAPEGAPAPAPGGQQPGGLFGGGIMGFMPMILMVVAFYFLLIAPQRKKQKEHQRLLSELDTGDQVLLASGIFGEITNRKEDRFVVRIADGVKVEVAKSFVQTVIKRKNDAAADKR
jgi:preprotein translocase subunit YajC